MSKIATLKALLKDRRLFEATIALKITASKLSHLLPDKTFLKLMYRLYMGTRLDLKNPKTFNEKLQWLKLYDRRPEYTNMVDKYDVRPIIAQSIGEEYLIPLLDVWNSFDDIDFSKLPRQFVLKCTHDSHSVFICKDKSSLDSATLKKIKKNFDSHMNRNFFYYGREWPYKNVVPRIIAEKYITDESRTELKDYKVLCFGGVPRVIETHMGRFTKEHYQDWYDPDWNKLEVAQVDLPTSPHIMKRPPFLEKMLDLSRKLSYGIPHIRIDWYFANQRLYFGELTFFDSSGFSSLEPKEFEELLGSWITLPGFQTVK